MLDPNFNLTAAGSGKDQKRSRSIVPGAAAGQGSEKVKDVILSTKVQTENTALELKNPSDFNESGPTTPTNVQQLLIPGETWSQVCFECFIASRCHSLL